MVRQLCVAHLLLFQKYFLTITVAVIFTDLKKKGDLVAFSSHTQLCKN